MKFGPGLSAPAVAMATGINVKVVAMETPQILYFSIISIEQDHYIHTVTCKLMLHFE